MKGFCFLCFFFMQFFSCVLLPAEGKPLQTGPGQVYAVSGDDAILHIPTTSLDPSRLTAVEWSRMDGLSSLTVHVMRDGKELVKEKAPKYLGRTAVMDDGSLKLFNVTQQDSGTYRCVLLRGPVAEDEVFVSLIVGEVPEVNMILQRTSDNEMSVQWESSGWSLRPQISLLDSRGNDLPAQTESSLGSDNLYSVKAQVDATAAKGVGTIICRVEIPGTTMVKEKQISINDDFIPLKEGLGSYMVLVVAIILISVVVFVVPMGIIKKLRSSLRHLMCYSVYEFCREKVYRKVSTMDASGYSVGVKQKQLSINGDERFKEYGDITSDVATKGTSKQLSIDNKQLSGVDASIKLAEKDLKKMMKYREEIHSVGDRLGIRPAIIAAVISRQSQAGVALRPDGYGQWDSNCFGLMQINKHYHAVKGGPYSEEHVDEGVTFLIQLIKTMRRAMPNWSKLQQLKGALASYIAGEEKVLKLIKDEGEDVDVDNVTPGQDFANDVIARAKWFAENGF